MTKIIALLLIMSGVAFGQMPTGAISLVSGNPVITPTCPVNFECHQYAVQCPNVVDAHPVRVNVGVWQATNAVRTDIFFGGHNGDGWWGTSGISQDFMVRLHNAGHTLVQTSWTGNGWTTSWGYNQGFVNLACREATVAKWAHDNYGSGSFAIVGGSEGSAAVGYMLAAYGVDAVSDIAVLISGPPMADIAEGCIDPPAGYAYAVQGETALVEQPFGFGQGVCGACCQHDPSWRDTWVANSVETVPGGDYFYPNTSVQFIIGGQDEPMIKNHAATFFNVLQANGQPNLNWALLPLMRHTIQQYQPGLDYLFGVLTQ